MIPYINKSSQESITKICKCMKIYIRKFKVLLQTALYLYKPSCFNFILWLYKWGFPGGITGKEPI